MMNLQREKTSTSSHWRSKAIPNKMAFISRFFSYVTTQHENFQDFFEENYTPRDVCRRSSRTPSWFALIKVPPTCAPAAPRDVCRSSPETPSMFALLKVPPTCAPAAPRGVCRSSPEAS